MPKRFHRKNRRKPSSKRGLVRLIKKVITSEAEQKFREDFNINTNIGVSGIERVLTAVPQGVNFGDRVGVEYQPDLLNLRFHLRLSSNPKPISARVYIIQNMVDTTPTSLPTNMATLMPNLLQSTVPYRILYDKSFDMSLGARSDINVQIKIPSHKMISVKFTGSGDNLYSQGKIIFTIITDNDVDDILSNSLSYRLVFHDT